MKANLSYSNVPKYYIYFIIGYIPLVVNAYMPEYSGTKKRFLSTV